MAITASTIFSAGDDRRRDASSGAIDSAKKLRALSSTLQEIHSEANWKFTTRTKIIDYFQGETDYNIIDSLSIADFKDVADLRMEDSHTARFSYLDSNSFDVRNGQSDSSMFYTVEYRLGTPILRINNPFGASRTLLGDTSDHDADGTWAADTTTSDATNIRTDTTEYREGGGSLRYDITVGQSVNNYADISVTTTSQTDLTDYRDFGSAFAWLYIPAIDQVTGITLRWGSSSSDYYSQSVTTNSQNGALETGWNRIKIPWSGASTTGSPTITAIDYILLRTSYGASQATDTDFRFNGLRFYLPTRMELLYYSSYTAKTSSGTWISEPTAETDILLIPDRYKEVVTLGYTANVLGQMGKNDESDKYHAKFRKALSRMSKELGVYPKGETKSFRPQIRWS